MTSASAASRWSLRSTRGGRTVQRTATAVQGASLRTLPLVRATTLTVLRDPWGALVAGPPDLAALGESADQATADRPGRARGRTRPAPLLLADPPQPRAVPAAPSVPGRRSAAPGPATVADRAATHADLGRLAHSDLPTHEPPTSSTARDRASTPTLRAPSRHPGLPERVTTPDLATAARRNRGPAPATSPPRVAAAPLAAPVAAPVHAGRDVASRVDDPEAGRSTAAVAGEPTSRSRADAPTGSANPAADALGALGELLSRWQEPAAPPEVTAPGLAPSPFAPLSTSATTGFGTPERAPEPVADDVDLDRIELALDQLLRREVEQHGLDGGLV